MRKCLYISLLTVLALSSCSRDFDLTLEDESVKPSHFVVGKVLDTDGKEIEHIKVTIDWGEHKVNPSVNYTASDGSFTTEVPQKIQSPTFEFKITLEDIDGEDNGGLFETITDKVIYSINPESPSEFITYRLNRATASESSPQS